ncbi:MAG: hypothetical protein BWX85_01313 [Chloroflexi bacterium ADurb.Bin120]|jgi:hypothetical protein|uniref:Uncharacterized protein n=1 Tax=Candidatus Brevifilum fermentans TaxID=1986204 RepID=A0A1Y6K579_9CHLR|nr:hypothetical protein [Brevefilum fermentans]OQB83419.1 MAG: hypothetical protein BWX85_01313 [Chloroflexi bacterium ADurb.Bin120]SMX54784.1 protein of unknown function [Brevefilum fermentans]HOM66464.1 hypothetical protein [Brevefilum fermentans]
MSKQFFTERDIEDLASQGVFTLTIGENVVLTELAFEKAQRLGVKLIQQHQLPPSAPIRPYLSETVAPSPSSQHHTAGLPLNKDESLRERIRIAVRAKLGDQVDPTLLETIITRVLDNIGAH